MISVCMATYNGEIYIKEQLESILKQINTTDEIVVSDDGSTDRTVEIVREINDPRIKIFFNEGTHGFTHNFENAIIRAKGDFIFLSDQDDIWLDDKVKIMMNALKDKYSVVSDCITVDENGEVITSSRFKEFDIKPGFLRHLFKSRFIGCCMAFRKDILYKALPFPKNDRLVEHDIWLTAVAFLYYDYELIYEPLILYRRHGKNTSEGGFSKGYSILNKIIRRVYRVFMLIKAGFRKRTNKAN